MPRQPRASNVQEVSQPLLLSLWVHLSRADRSRGPAPARPAPLTEEASRPWVEGRWRTAFAGTAAVTAGEWLPAPAVRIAVQREGASTADPTTVLTGP